MCSRRCRYSQIADRRYYVSSTSSSNQVRSCRCPLPLRVAHGAAIFVAFFAVFLFLQLCLKCLTPPVQGTPKGQ